MPIKRFVREQTLVDSSKCISNLPSSGVSNKVAWGQFRATAKTRSESGLFSLGPALKKNIV
jgi:hypothetical protein